MRIRHQEASSVYTQSVLTHQALGPWNPGGSGNLSGGPGPEGHREEQWEVLDSKSVRGVRNFLFVRAVSKAGPQPSSNHLLACYELCRLHWQDGPLSSVGWGLWFHPQTLK